MTPAEALCSFVDHSPSPFHVCATVAGRLEANGFSLLDETAAWPVDPGRYFVVRGGSLVAWSTDDVTGPADPYRIVGGHTDSPNLRVKQRPDLARAGWELVGLEPYGGALLNSWLDRDLGVSGRVSVRTGQRTEPRLVHVDRPVLRVPQLAIHLSDNRKGVELDPQHHVDAVWGVGGEPRSFLRFVADKLEVRVEDVHGWELMVHDLVPSSVFGRASDMLSAPRLDNQGTCFAATEAMIRTVRNPAEGLVPVLALFDHEEVGSMSDRGAFSEFLGTVLERIVLVSDGTREDFHRAVAGSICASGDMAHATHPNYVDRHEPGHPIVPNGGPVLKVNTNLRYATDSAGAGTFALACDQAGVPLQRFVQRADLPCGSTVGPITASRTGISTVDVGAPQLAMHSAREMMGADDPQMYIDALAAFLAPE